MRHNRNTARGLFIILAVVFIFFCIVLVMDPAAAYEGEPVRTERQETIHEAADILRSYGYAEDSEAIKALGAAWAAEQEALDIIAKTIQNEADPAWCDWEHSVAVGAVLIIYPDGKCVVEDGKTYQAVPVPPHGDLIERDALLKGDGRYIISFGREGIDVAEIERAPIIIPASEEGE